MMDDRADLDDFLAQSGYAGPAMEAARARALVWQLAQKILRENPSETMTIAELSQTLTQTATDTLGMTEDELLRLLRSHIPH